MPKQRWILIFAVVAIWAFAVGEQLLSSTRGGPTAPLVSASPQRKTSAGRGAGTYGAPVVLARLQTSTVTESSGIAASRNHPGLFWTHNDSGDGPFIYSFDRQGKSRGVWRVSGASARDWEDIAAGPGPEPNRNYLYLGDIGDNGSTRATIIVYRVPEPTIKTADANSTRSKAGTTEAAETIQLRYPDGRHDAETLLVHPVSGDLYVITKELWGNASVYKATAPLDAIRTTTLVLIGNLKIPGLLGGTLTGGDISPDGRRVALCDYLHGYEIVLGERNSETFDSIWKRPVTVIELGPRKQGEAICYSLDGKALLATSEGARSPLIEVVRR